ncbi:MFS transporter [Macrococcus sp. DPC7161]|uniref:MFS transporter n=1 Tax=Macrococcus sp. DPC7161 TaxID=2507060 RepID=UPI00100BF19E|nr:MFS transporter [Macrococcus sp. DPC7161]RXK17509.1 MFS transporter [Macrococcus sp. DPC7161]
MPRIYYNILIAQLCYSAGFIFYNVTVTFFVYNNTGSTFYASLITFLNLVSKIISKFFIQDMTMRWSIKSVLIINTSVQIFFLFMLFFIMFIKFIPFLFIITTLISFLNGMFYPLKNTLIKLSLNKDLVSKAVAGISTFDQAIMFSGYIIAGWLLAETNIFIAMFVGLCIYFIGVINLLWIHNDKHHVIKKAHKNKKSIVEGYRILFNIPLLKELTIIEFIEALISTIWIGAIQLAFITEYLNVDERWWGYMNASYFCGTLLGAMLIYKYQKIGQSKMVILVCMCIYIISVVLYSFNINPIISVILILVMGIVFQSKDILQESLIISTIPEEQITIISAFKSTIIEFGYLLSVLFIGLYAELVPIQYVYFTSGIIYLVCIYLMRKVILKTM